MQTKDKLVTLEELGVLQAYTDAILASAMDDVQAGTQETKANHLGFYIDNNGYLCQDD